MSDPVTAPVVPTTVAEAAPVIAPTPAVAPVEVVQTAPVTPAPVPAPVAETPPAPAVEAPVAPVESTTALGDALKPEIKPAVEPDPNAPKAAETVEGQSDEPAPPPKEVPEAPKYEPFTLPENVSLDEAKVSEFTNLLSDLEMKGKADHALVQEFGQKAVDLFINEQKNLVEQINKTQLDTWEKTKTTWKDQTLADPEIGGNRFQTALTSAQTFIRTHGGTAEQQAEFRALMDTSGLGNHPAMIRLLAKAGASMVEGSPLAATKPVTPSKSKTETMYGRK